MKYKHSNLTHQIIKAYYNVYNKLGYGFMEKVYENAMMIELKEFGLSCNQQMPIKVTYRDKIIGDYYADIVIENKVIVELKAVSEVLMIHEVQLVNYLKATGIEVGLLLNFGHEPQHYRKVLTTDYK